MNGFLEGLGAITLLVLSPLLLIFAVMALILCVCCLITALALIVSLLVLIISTPFEVIDMLYKQVCRRIKVYRRYKAISNSAK